MPPVRAISWVWSAGQLRIGGCRLHQLVIISGSVSVLVISPTIVLVFWFCVFLVLLVCGFAAVAGHILHKYDGVAAWWWRVLQWTRDTTAMS
jgi:hypothetical protein